MVDHTDILNELTAGVVKQIMPDVQLSAIRKNLPIVLEALRAFGLVDIAMALFALVTIRVETGGFAPISEFTSKFNTNKKPFDRYEPGTRLSKTLGNTQPGDGLRFRARGFVQLPGRANYARLSKKIGVDLVNSPEKAKEPVIAGKILAQVLKEREQQIRSALNKNDVSAARKSVNGSAHGADEFATAFFAGRRIFDAVDPAETRGRVRRRSAKTRHINAWIEDAAPPLQTGRTYRLGINIGRLRERALASAEFREPDWKDKCNLLIVVSGHGFAVQPRQHDIDLPRSGETEPVFFAVTPTRQGDFLLRISFYLARELALLQEFEIPIEVQDAARAA